MANKNLYRQSIFVLRTQAFDLDNGAGTTVDEVLLDTGGRSGRIVRAYALYQVLTGTVAAGNWKIGIAAGGATLVAATAYEDAAAVGAITVGTVLIGGYVPAGEEIFVRHTGVAATQAGTAVICVEFAFDD